MRVRIALAASVVALFSTAPAFAQSEDGSLSGDTILPRNSMPAPPGSPGPAECSKAGCIYLVNISGYRVTELHYALGKDATGKPLWSANQFASDFDFYSKRWTAWFKPKELACTFALKIVMKIDDRLVEESGEFDTCVNPTLLFYIRDPREKRGTVTVDPTPVSQPPQR